MELPSPAHAEETISELVSNYERVLAHHQQDQFSEQDVSTKFALPLLGALGWDTGRIEEVKEQKRTLTGPVDYSLNLNGRPKIVVELKKFSESLDGKRVVRGEAETFAEQALRYAFHLRTDWVVLTNFGELRLYFTGRIRPQDAQVFSLKFKDYLPRFKDLWLLSKESAVSGQLDSYSKRRERHDIDGEILSDLLDTRANLSSNIAKSNPTLAPLQVRDCVQKIMDRLMVARVAEDRGILGSDSIWRLLEAWRSRGLQTPFLRSLKGLFRDFDQIYNSNLFSEDPSEDLAIDNKVLEQAITELYKYNFDLINADVLGSIYEDYLGHVLRSWQEGVRIEESREARKKAGVFYTPTKIVDLIVNSTLGKKLSGLTSVEDVMKLAILDPACGSGSFLIKAFDAIKTWYKEYNQRITLGKTALERHFGQIVDEEKIILSKNIYGVDIDEQAAEVASVNLILKAIRRGEKLPRILRETLKVGNSLIDCPDEVAEKYFGETWKEKKPFRWKNEFPDVMSTGGFDIIFGNPPYVDIYTIPKDDRRYFTESRDFCTIYKKFDLYALFFERALRLLRDGGTMSFILPDKIKSASYAERLRKYVLDSCTIDQLVDFGTLKVFPHSSVRNVIFVVTKTPSKEQRDANSVEIRTITQLEPELKWTTERMPQRLFYETPGFEWRLQLFDNSIRDLISKIESGSVPLGQIYYANWGLRTGTQEKTKSMITKENNDPRSKPLIRGENIRGKYSLVYDGDYVVYDTSSEGLVNPMFPEFFEKRKIVIRKISGSKGLFATIDQSQKYCFSTIIGCLPYHEVQGVSRVRASSEQVEKSRDFSIMFVLGVINSTLIDFYYGKRIGDRLSVVPSHVQRLPIRPAKRETQDKITSFVEQILSLQAQLDEIEQPDFPAFVTRYQALINTERVRLVTIREFARSMNLDQIRLGPSNGRHDAAKPRGQLSSLSVKEVADWVEFEASVRLDDSREVQAVPLSLRIIDPVLRTYLKLAVPSYNRLPFTGTEWTQSVMSCKVARLAKNVIYRIVQEFEATMQRRQQLLFEIASLRDEVDTLVFDLYGLNSEERETVRTAGSVPS